MNYQRNNSASTVGAILLLIVLAIIAFAIRSKNAPEGMSYDIWTNTRTWEDAAGRTWIQGPDGRPVQVIE